MIRVPLTMLLFIVASMQPAAAQATFFIYTDALLTDSCGGGSPLANDTPVELMWDANANGPDSTDDVAPSCQAIPPPEAGVTNVTVTLWDIDSDNPELLPHEQCGTMLQPPLFYLAVRGTQVTYFSDTIRVVNGLNEYLVTQGLWGCAPNQQQSTAAPLPLSPRVDHAYPNPTNGSVTFRFSVGGEQQLSLSIFDLLGRKVATVLEGRVSPGSYSASFPVHGLASGLYLYRLQGPDGTHYGKLAIVR